VTKIHDRPVVFLISEANVKRMLTLPYVSFGFRCCVDVGSQVFADWGTRIPGLRTFAEVPGKIFRDRKSGFPAGSHSPPHRFAGEQPET